MYDNDVFDVTVFDRDGNELSYRHIKRFDRVTDYLANVVLTVPKASKATVYGQHGQYGEVNLDEMYDRLVIEGYIR